MRSIRLVLLLAVVALVAAACAVGTDGHPGTDAAAGEVIQDPEPDPKAPSGGDVASDGFVVGGGLTIPEAIAYDGDEVVAVQGFVVLDGQTNAFCELLAESLPPLCGGATLTITNPEATTDLVLTEAQGVQWSDNLVTLFGRISDGALTIDSTVSG